MRLNKTDEPTRNETTAELELRLTKFRSDLMEYRGDLMEQSFAVLVRALEDIRDSKLLSNDRTSKLREIQHIARTALKSYEYLSMEWRNDL